MIIGIIHTTTKMLHRHQLLMSVVYGVWNTYDTRRTNKNKPLDLVSNYYHEETGLHNEGVWHNALMMMNYYLLLLTTAKDDDDKQYLSDALIKVTNSLIELNYDSTGTLLFKQRTETEYWSHENANNNTHLLQLYERTDHTVFKLMSNSIALLAYSLVNDKVEQDKIDLKLFLSQILKYFHDDQHELYFTKVKIVNNNARIIQDDHNYFKACDHAVLLIALIVMEHRQIELPENLLYSNLKKQLRDCILNKFGYHSYKTINTYYEPNRSDNKIAKRFLWQDIWVYISLLISSSDPSNDKLIRDGVVDLFNMFYNEQNGLLYGDPKPELYDQTQLASKSVTADDGSTRTVYISPQSNFYYNCYTGDNSLLYGLLSLCESYGCSWIHDHPSIKQFMTCDYEKFINKQFENNNTSRDLFKNKFPTKYLSISETIANQALWPHSEFLLSMLFVRNLKQLLRE
jgi:hypothetical protein